MTYVTGDPGAVTTGEITGNDGDRDSGSVTVEGPLDVVRDVTNFASFIPRGTVSGHRLTTDGKGGGKLVINWIDYGQGSIATTATDITWRIDMAEVQTPLQNHPKIPAVDRKEIFKWLATDPILRFNKDNGSPQWVDENGSATPVAQPYAQKFVNCYLRGIETYNRYFPVMEKISKFKTLPGANMSDNKTTGGRISQFSAFSLIGTYEVPDLTLSGFDNHGWFKSGDSYTQGEDRVWTRNEQWTWTPDFSDNDVKWIYDS